MTARLWWGVAVSVALLLGFGLGLWIGGAIEQDVLVELIARANLDENCRLQLQNAMEAVIGEP
jgi:hypothetical protein